MTESAEASVGGVNVSRETFAALQALESLVRRWTPAINLVGKSSLANFWSRHIADSAQIFSLCPPTATLWADFGSGGGFPGLVVAVLAKEHAPAMRITLVESDQRKATFLRQAVHALALNADVVNQRVESIASISADVVSARALASLAELLSLAELHMKANGVAIFPKGSKHAEEVADARKAWSFDVHTVPSLSDADAAILEIRNIRRAQN